MDQVQATDRPEAQPATFAAAQSAYEIWMRLNTRVAQMWMDAGLAQLSGMQELVSGRLTPFVCTGGDSPEKLTHTEIGFMHRQVENAVKLGRHMADDARRSAFEFADAMVQLPFHAAKTIDAPVAKAEPKK